MPTGPCTYCGRKDTGKRIVNRHGTFCNLRNPIVRQCWIVYKDLKGIRE